MAVLPPYSSHALPVPFKPLMLEDSSEIIDFYPDEFKVDLKGKAFAWLGEVILPFINERRLKKALDKKKVDLTPEDLKRNRRGTYLVFYNTQYIQEGVTDNQSLQEIKGRFSTGSLSEVLEKPISEENSTIKVHKFQMPLSPPHDCKLLKGVTMPKKYLPPNVPLP